MSSRPFESPPPYRPDEFKPSHYAPSNITYAEEMRSQPMYSQPAYSYYPEDEVQHFYKWTSPPGIIKIMSVLIIVMCVGIFACVASTLPWDLEFYGSSSLGSGVGYPGYSGFGGSYGGSYSYGSAYGYGGAYGIGGNYIEPRAAKGFILAMSAFCFIAGMAIFIISVTNSSMSRTRRYYLIVIIVSAILGFLVFIASIVYVLAVNPTAQASGSVFYNQLVALCSQYYASTNTGIFVNQYLYHYCVVEPQEAIAIVLGFLVIVAFAIIIYFSVKTRSQMNYYGKMNILWDKVKVYEEDPPNVEEWVKTVNAEPAEIPGVDYPDRVASSMVYSVSEKVNENRVYTDAYRAMPKSEVIVPLMKDLTQSNYTGNSSYDGSTKEPPQKRRAGRRKRTNSDNYDADYTTGGESCDELEEDWDREYPPVTTDQQRQTYKRDFDSGLQEYKSLQAELDEVSKTLSRLDKELDDYSEDSEEYKVAADEYNRMKDIKASADYKNKKAQCKKLKSKLSHVKRMVSDYDNRRS
ncbi:occludin [Mauremys reevesii]|uniref:occludin n=1 Tax=Mauremys reevesii TaxID=260615 RepID=UPI00193F43C2|nr:occludin [Mauremys reevesii]XP_039401072.1 occludin [Mauremys reevesii]XP_039401073.1 occludin [Mauremys reevesii]XP_039401074.1 occludin [Mauremys reevesii]XP_039401075.1 occludin [Mauremys reevesii]